MDIRQVYRQALGTAKKLNPSLCKTSKTPDTLRLPFGTSHNSLASPEPQTMSKNLSPVLKGGYIDMREHFIKARQAILTNLKESLSPNRDPTKAFHKSSNFISRKQKIRENVKNHKFESSDKLLKLKSIVETNKEAEKEFITQDDMLNGEASQFLLWNKRKFGETKLQMPVFKKNKSNGVNQAVKIKPKYSSVPDLKVVMTRIDAAKPLSVLGKNKELNGFEKKKIGGEVPVGVKRYIVSEMKKLWPQDANLINEKKRKILKVKIDKLQSILEEATEERLEDEAIGGCVSLDQKMRMDKLVDQHFKSLRMKLLT